MTMLLQCPKFFRSPSRNQTPSATLAIVSGLASECAAKKASEASAPNPNSSPARVFFILFSASDLAVRLALRDLFERVLYLNRQRRPNPMFHAIGQLEGSFHR